MPLFQDLETAQLDQLLDRHRQTTHQVEQLIVMEQDWGESVFLLRSGLAKVRTYTADGDEVVIFFTMMVFAFVIMLFLSA